MDLFGRLLDLSLENNAFPVALMDLFQKISSRLIKLIVTARPNLSWHYSICVYIVLIINSMLHDNFYEVIVGCYHACTCIDFISMLASSTGKEGKYVPCKHLYFIYAKRMNYDTNNFFIHQPTLGWNEVHCLLQKDKV